ncbi:uncharacterized protein LOC101851560 isoform X2 [Aplysia californica]|uniref:Uncharacterized protein LOC101851560 isoform X2 n=1 Tax=Aplysia californica TaxID=6500 RepID=A0ABM0JEE4_APLCA|nr:uncharacterized protein LOC101851560 isoform X2 [Aplysia californica]XP_035829768.1 uncharacterized protein LOC101851560 isoform X2 [Aplysia californica]
MDHFYKRISTQDLPHDNLLPDLEEPWYMSNIGLLSDMEYLQVIEDGPQRIRLKAMIEEIDSTFSAVQDRLSKGILHGDFHGYNLIVEHSFNSQMRRCSLKSNILKEFKALKEELRIKNNPSSLPSFASILQQKCNRPSFEEILETYGIIDYGEVSFSFIVLEVGRLIVDLMTIVLSKPPKEEGVDVCKYPVYFESDVSEQLHREVCVREPSKNEHIPISENSITNCTKDSVQSCEARTKIPKGESAKQTKLMKTDKESRTEHFLRDVVGLGGVALSGYLLTNTLTDVDISILKASVMSSLIQYYILGTKAMAEQPENSQYVGLGAAEAERLLWVIDSMSQNELHQAWIESAIIFLT